MKSSVRRKSPFPQIAPITFFIAVALPLVRQEGNGGEREGEAAVEGHIAQPTMAASTRDNTHPHARSRHSRLTACSARVRPLLDGFTIVAYRTPSLPSRGNPIRSIVLFTRIFSTAPRSTDPLSDLVLLIEGSEFGIQIQGIQ